MNLLKHFSQRILGKNYTLFKSVSSYAIISVFNGLFNLLFITYYARVLDVYDMGVIGLVLTITYITVPLSFFGTLELVGINTINYSLRKFISFLNELISFSFIILPILFVITFAATLYFNQGIIYFIVIIIFSILRTYIGISDKLYIVNKKIKLFAKEKIRTSLLTLILGIIFVYFYESWVSYFVSIMIAELLSCINRYSKGFKYFKVIFHKKQILYFIKYGFPIIVGLGAAWLLNQFDKLIVESYFDITVLGGYALAYQLGLVIRTFNTSISNAIYPNLYESFKKGSYLRVQKRAFILFLIIGIICFVLLFIFMKYFFSRIYGIKYEQFYYVVLIIGLSFLFEGLHKPWGSLIIYLKKNTEKTLISYFSAFTGIAVSLLTIKFYGMFAPAFGVLIAYFSLFLLSLVYSLFLCKQYEREFK